MRNGYFRDILGRCREYIRRLAAMEISLHASHACYFIVLAVFPALSLLLGLLRYTVLTPADLMELAQGILPDALELYFWQLISGTAANTSRLVLSVSALLTLWSASRGMFGLLTGLNGVYGREEHRSWLRTRLMSAVYTVLFVLVLILTLVLMVFGSTLGEFLALSGNARPGRWLSVVDLRLFALVAAQTAVFCAMFMFLPEGGNGLRESLPGALFGSLGWMAFSVLFSVYVENFSRYANLYGSVYTAVLAMLWLYMCVSILFYGGALNCFLAERRKKENNL